jgi:hypothetical protein
VDRADFGVGVGGEKSEKLMLALDRVRLGAALAVPCRPDAGNRRRRRRNGFALVPRLPCHVVQMPAIDGDDEEIDGVIGRQLVDS